MFIKSGLFLIVGCCTFLCSDLAKADAVMGQPAPAFQASALDGKPFDVSTLKGKVVVINIWATWCPPCRDEMPALEAVWRKYQSKGLNVIAVSADRPRSRGDVKQVMQYFTFPAAMLSDVTKNDFGATTVIPVTYIIGKDGVVADILTPQIKPLTEQGLGDEVKNLLDAKTDVRTDDKSDITTDTKPDTK